MLLEQLTAIFKLFADGIATLNYKIKEVKIIKIWTRRIYKNDSSKPIKIVDKTYGYFATI